MAVVGSIVISFVVVVAFSLLFFVLVGNSYQVLPAVAWVGFICFGLGAFVVQEIVRNRSAKPAQVSIANLEYVRPSKESSRITSSTIVDAEIDKFLKSFFYEFVDGWYKQITENPELKDRLRSIVCEFIALLEARLWKVNWTDLMYRDAIFVVAQHIKDLRHCKSVVGTTYAGGRSVEDLFFRTQPHFALTDDKHEKEYVRQVVEWLLFLLVPEAELHSEALRLLLRELLTNVLFVPVMDLLIEPDFVYKTLILLLSPEDELQTFLAVSPATIEPVRNFDMNDSSGELNGTESVGSKRQSTLFDDLTDADIALANAQSNNNHFHTTKPSQVDVDDTKIKKGKYRVPMVLKRAFGTLAPSSISTTAAVTTDSSPPLSPPISRSISTSTSQNSLANPPNSSPLDAPADAAAVTPAVLNAHTHPSLSLSSFQSNFSALTSSLSSYMPNSHSTASSSTASTHGTTATTASLPAASVHTEGTAQKDPALPRKMSSLFGSITRSLSISHGQSTTVPQTAIPAAGKTDRISSMFRPRAAPIPVSVTNNTTTATTATTTKTTQPTAPPPDFRTKSTTAAVSVPTLRRSNSSQLDLESQFTNFSPSSVQHGSVEDSQLDDDDVVVDKDPLGVTSWQSTRRIPTSRSVNSTAAVCVIPPTVVDTAKEDVSVASNTITESNLTDSGLVCDEFQSTLVRSISNESGTAADIEDELDEDPSSLPVVRLQDPVSTNQLEPPLWIDDQYSSLPVAHFPPTLSPVPEESPQFNFLESNLVRFSKTDEEILTRQPYDKDHTMNDQPTDPTDSPESKQATSNESESELTANLPQIHLELPQHQSDQPEPGSTEDLVVESTQADESISDLTRAEELDTLPTVHLPSTKLPPLVDLSSASPPSSSSSSSSSSMSWQDMISYAQSGWQMITQLQSSTDFGPFTSELHTNDHLDEPVYFLVDTIFNLSESSRSWLYALFMYIIKPTLQFIGGDLVNRIILKLLAWIISEERISFYIQMLYETMWPNGVWAAPTPKLTEAQSIERRASARRLLGRYLSFAEPVLGTEITNDGGDLLLEMFQSKRINKHLMFVALDLVLGAIFPEMKLNGSKQELPYLSAIRAANPYRESDTTEGAANS